jgi:hypothetical protein
VAVTGMHLQEIGYTVGEFNVVGIKAYTLSITLLETIWI